VVWRLALFATAFIEGYDLNRALATEQGFMYSGKEYSEKNAEHSVLAEEGREVTV
jgi:hypothetical protein